MKLITAILFACMLTLPDTAKAGQAEVRDVAINNHCPPKKIEIYKQSLGALGDIIYRVQCVLPKTVGATENAPKPMDAILVGCQQNLCGMLRPLEMEKK